MALLRRRARLISLVLRLTIVTLLVLALAGIEYVTASDRLSVVFLVDRSDSIGVQARAAQERYIREAMQSQHPSDASGVVVFGSSALIDRPVTDSRTPPDLTSSPPTTFSNIDSAIRLGLAAAPAGSARRLVLLSDGRENLGSAEWAARLVAADGASLDVVSIATDVGPDVAIAGVVAPSTARPNERTSLDITIQSSSDTTTTLRLFADGQPLMARTINLTRGQNNFAQNLPILPVGMHLFRAVVESPPAADTVAPNNAVDAFTVVLGKPRVLIVEGHAGEAASLQAALSPSVDVDVVAPVSAPADLQRLAQYKGLVLVNVPATSLSGTQMRALQSAVRDLGEGLVVVGGDESYAAGGYFRTPLEEMLPVDLHLPSKLDIPTVAMVLVIDRSGSMGESHNLNGTGVTKLSLAEEAAYRAVAQLSEKDYVGVVAFDEAANWIVEPQRLGDPQRFAQTIRGISPGGGTNIYSGLSPAVSALVASKARSKHIVLLTDGVSEEGDYASLLKTMGVNNITLSTVGIGNDADQNFLKDLASRGNGRYYYTGNGDALPEIFAHESHIAARSYLVEHRFTPQRSAPSPILNGIGGLPDLLGYIGTSQKPGGQVNIVSDAGDPLLAQWQYGIGRVVAWTSDAKGQWGKEWIPWEDFARFWAQTVGWATGTEDGGVLQSRVTVSGQTGHITVEAQSQAGQPLNNLASEASIVAPGLLTSTVVLAQTAPGRYEGDFNASEQGVYLMRAAASGSEVGNVSQTVGLVVPYSPEYRSWETGDTLLPRLAAITGGRVLSSDDTAAAFDHNLSPVQNEHPLWPFLVFLSVLLLPFDIGVRRLALTRQDIGRWLAGLGPAREPAHPLPALVSSATQVATKFDAKRRERQGSALEFATAPAEVEPAGQARRTADGLLDTADAAPRARELQSNIAEAREKTQVNRVEASHAPDSDRSADNEQGLAARLREAREKRH